MSTLWFVVMNIAMIAVGTVYAAILDRRRVYRWFYPKRTWLTVVVGVLLVGIPWGILWLYGVVSTFDIVLYITLFADVGFPIGLWQYLNGRKLDEQARKVQER
jgi:hypothetical protein